MQSPAFVPESEILRRRDVRNLLTFTIDPADAKDFDDALSFTKQEDGTFLIGVHIADVSHYAKERWKNQIALSLAKDAAVQSGKKISDDEAQELVRALFDLPQYMFTPDGKKVISILSDEELQSRFGIGR